MEETDAVLGTDLLISRFKWGVRYKDVMSGVLPFALFVTHEDAELFLERITAAEVTAFEIVAVDHIADGEEK